MTDFPPNHTTIDPPVGEGAQTTLDNTAETRVDGAAQPGYPPMGLPGDLTGRVEFVRVLSMHSSEADVLLVREVAGGTQRVVKFYRRPFENFDEDLFSRIQSATAENVVETIDAGWEVNDSSGATTRRRWELLEYCEGGTLAELIDQHPGGMPEDLVNDVVIEVGQALVELHAPPLEVAHRDLKPENIFIRTREPLDLALGDFGLSMALRATVIGGDLSRTIEYSAPEAAYGMVRREGDWYSFGLILVEMITGQHPFRSVDGQASIAQYIEYAKATKPIDLSAITSARFQQLCSGLLQHDADRRWGSAEFTRWINGEDVPVPEAETPVDLTARTECPFPDADGAEIAKHASPQTLAVAMAGNWNAASQMVGLTSGEFSWLAGPFREFLESTGNTDALAMVSGDHRDETMLTRLMSQLAPELPPVFRSRNISDSTAIAALANSARSDEAAAADLDALREGRVLKVFGRRKVEGTEFTYVELDQQWTDAYRRATQRNQESIEAGISLRPLDVEKLREMAKSMTLEVLVSERQRDSVAESIEQLGGSGVASSTGFAIEDDAAPHLHYADQIALMLVGTVLQVKSGETGGAEATPASPSPPTQQQGEDARRRREILTRNANERVRNFDDHSISNAVCFTVAVIASLMYSGAFAGTFGFVDFVFGVILFLAIAWCSARWFEYARNQYDVAIEVTLSVRSAFSRDLVARWSSLIVPTTIILVSWQLYRYGDPWVSEFMPHFEWPALFLVLAIIALPLTLHVQALDARRTPFVSRDQRSDPKIRWRSEMVVASLISFALLLVAYFFWIQFHSTVIDGLLRFW
ncbi:MAG: protein kinase domain-containing protein [Solirubrobacterales bacterium]